jgi:hypothetical protein
VSPFDDGAHPWHPAIMWPQLSACTGVAPLKIAVVIPTAPNAAIATIRNMAVFIRDTNKTLEFIHSVTATMLMLFVTSGIDYFV